MAKYKQAAAWFRGAETAPREKASFHEEGAGSVKWLFCNIAKMDSYCGPEGEMTGAGSFVETTGLGVEMWNFQRVEGKCYGFVETKGVLEYGENGKMIYENGYPRSHPEKRHEIGIERIEHSKSKAANKVEGVLVVWCAKRKVIGWYENCTVFRKFQILDDEEIVKFPDRLKLRDATGDFNQYFFRADAEGSVLLPLKERETFAPNVPRGAGGFGQSNIWYADTDTGLDYRRRLLPLIKNYNRLI